MEEKRHLLVKVTMVYFVNTFIAFLSKCHLVKALTAISEYRYGNANSHLNTYDAPHILLAAFMYILLTNPDR